MKKFISIVLVTSLVFSLSACMKKTENKEHHNSTDNAVATTEQRKYDTFTGRKPLDEVKFKIEDPQNSRGLSINLIEHSYGVAKNGKAHTISFESQSFFESKKFSAVTLGDVGKNQIYLTFDCGYENGYTSKILDVLKDKNVKAAFFCTLDNIKAEPELISRMINEGHIVGNHSTTHPSFDKLTREEMANEIEECENYLRTNFGYSSKFFRFPMGNYSESALDLVSSLGMTSVFWSLAYSDWNTEKQKGADYAFEKVTQRLHPGAIILLHSVSADNAGALSRIIDNARIQGYEFSTLDKISLTYSNYIT